MERNTKINEELTEKRLDELGTVLEVLPCVASQEGACSDVGDVAYEAISIARELNEKRGWWNKRRLAKNRTWSCSSGTECKGDRFTARQPDEKGSVYCSVCQPDIEDDWPAVGQYIFGLDWGEMTDRERTLVAGNIRGYASAQLKGDKQLNREVKSLRKVKGVAQDCFDCGMLAQTLAIDGFRYLRQVLNTHNKEFGK